MKMQTIVGTVCQEFGVSRRSLYGVTRKSEIVEARQVAFYLLRQMLRASYRVIGAEMVRDHTTVGFGYRQVARRLRHDAVLKQRIAKIKQRLLRKHR